MLDEFAKNPGLLHVALNICSRLELADLGKVRILSKPCRSFVDSYMKYWRQRLVVSARNFRSLVHFENQFCKCRVHYEEIFDKLALKKDYKEHKRMALFMTRVNNENSKNCQNPYFFDCPLFYSVFWSKFKIFKIFLPYAKVNDARDEIRFVGRRLLEDLLMEEEPKLPRFCLVQCHRQGFISDASLIQIFNKISPEKLFAALEFICNFWNIYSDPRKWRDVCIFLYLFDGLFKEEKQELWQWLVDEITGQKRETMYSSKENFELYRNFCMGLILTPDVVQQMRWLHGMGERETKLKIRLGFVSTKHTTKEDKMQIIFDLANEEFTDRRLKVKFIWPVCMHYDLVPRDSRGLKQFRERIKQLK